MAISRLQTACSTGKSGPVLSVESARLRALAAARPMTDIMEIAAAKALGLVIAEPAVALSDLPPFDNSAMDGFAIDVTGLTGSGPWQLRVAGRIAAGDTRRHALASGCAARIFTGAPIPAGANAVIMQEHVPFSNDVITIAKPPAPGQNIRRRGEDRPIGLPPVPKGQVLSPPRLALLAATGVGDVSVYRRLRVGILSTGNELREPGEALDHGQIYNSNRVLLHAMLAQPWVEIADYGIVRDEPDAIRDAIRKAAAGNDVVISSGGVSAGEEDHVLDALKREDASLEVLKVAIRPGKPLTVGRVGNALYFGLPGNPYAAAITFSQIAMPALRKSAGITETVDNWLPCVSNFSYVRTTGRTEYVPVTWENRDALGRPVLSRLGQSASASLGPIALARGIAVIPSEISEVVPGMPITVEQLC